MKALFNGTCTSCNLFKPRCAAVVLTRGKGREVGYRLVTLCADCRKMEKGNYRLDPRHK